MPKIFALEVTHMRKTPLTTYLVCLLTLTVATACGGGAAPTAEAPAEEAYAEDYAASSDIRFMGWSNNSKSDQLQRELLEECGIAYDLENNYSDYWQQLLTMINAGEPPDIFYIDAQHLPQYAQVGLLLCPDDAGDVNWDAYLDHAIKAFSYEGYRYAVPREFSTMALYYNRQLFEELGLEERTTTGPGTSG